MLTGAIFKKAFISGANTIERHQADVDALNVFPVPDGDTGTNMSMTAQAAAKELMLLPDTATVSEAAETAASALLRGARGNSGVILSLIFRGISKELRGKTEADAETFAAAFAQGSASAYKAVMKPTEGTILTVIRKASEKAKAEAENKTCAELMGMTLEAAEEALSKTPEQLPVLKKAGVVDAGGQGLVYILEGMKSVISDGEEVTAAAAVSEASAKPTAAGAVQADIEFGYCSEFLIRRENEKDPEELRAYLGAVGDCAVVVPDGDIIKVHVHSNEPGNVIQTALTYGQLIEIKIDNMRYQHANAALGVKPAEPEDAEPLSEYGFVAVAAGEGFEDLFGELGVDYVVCGGQTMNPSTEDILKAIESTRAEHIFVLPNNKNIIMAAQQAALLTKRDVRVLATRNMPQGITAMLNFDPDLPPEENEAQMAAAADNVHTAQITFAARDSEMGEQQIHEGQILGMEDGKITLIEDDAVNAAYRTTRRIIKKTGGSLVTVFYGNEISETAAEQVADRLRERFPDIEVNVANGGQPVYFFIASVE